jgi:hypothetical protein
MSYEPAAAGIDRLRVRGYCGLRSPSVTLLELRSTATPVSRPRTQNSHTLEWMSSGRFTSMLRWRIGVAVVGILPVFAASVSHQLFVQVGPEVALWHQDEATLLLKIRLKPGAQATLWNAKICDAPDSGAYPVARSGIYSIPLSVIPGPADAGTCLASSDGTFAVFLPSTGAARTPKQ